MLIIDQHGKFLPKSNLHTLFHTNHHTSKYLLNYLDRGNIGNSKLLNSETGDSLMQQTNMSNLQYAVAVSLFAVAYAVFEVPSMVGDFALLLGHPHNRFRWREKLYPGHCPEVLDRYAVLGVAGRFEMWSGELMLRS
jgi:hypothetical protein